MQQFNHLSSHIQQPDSNCPLCTGQNFSVMLNRALYDRYLANVNMYYTDKIHDFMEQQITPQTCKFREQMCDDYDQELLKRQYAANQFPGKIQMLSEYYKFHRDIPKIFEKSVFRILGKYFDRLRHFDYKKIKCVLKEEQGISLTTEKSEESSFCSDQIKKSKYSTVLCQLNVNSQSQSQILQNMCEKIDKAYENVNFKDDYKGQYYSGQKKFKEYLLNIKKVNHKSSKAEFSGTNFNEKLKNYNLLHKPLSYQHLNHFTLKTDRVDSKKKSLKKKGAEIQLQNNNALKESLRNFKKIKNKNSKSIEKTTANETISRQEKSRRMQKLQKTLQFQIEKNQNAIFKPFSTGLVGLKSNAMLKTLEQIYKPISVHQKYHSDKSSKTSQQQSVNNLQKLYENKLSGRKSNSNFKSKQTSQHNSKQIQSHLNKDKDHLQNCFIENQQDTQRLSLKRKETSVTKFSSHKKLSRSKSVSKTINSHVKTSQKALQTIDYQANQKKGRSKSIKKSEDQRANRLSNYLKQKQNILSSANKPENKLKERQSSRKNLHSTNKERSTSKKNLSSTKKLERNSSKSNVTSARGSNVDKVKFHTMDPDANKNIEKYLQRKLTIVQKQDKPKFTKAKFYN